MIRIYKRKWGRMKLIHEIDHYYNNIHMSSGGVLTIKAIQGYTRLCLAPGEWHKATLGDYYG